MNAYPCCSHCPSYEHPGSNEHIDECAYGCNTDGEISAAAEYEEWDGLTDVEADAMTLAGAGWGTDEDYGYFGGDEW
jgi:hypothetical protein